MHETRSDNIKQASFFLLLVFLAIFLFLQLSSFLPALLGALTLYILMKNLMSYLVLKKKWNTGLAATFLMLVSFLIFLLPATMFINVLYTKIDYAIANSNNVLAGLKMFIEKIEISYHITLISDKNIEGLGIAIAQLLPNLLGATINSLVTIIIMYIILYFLLSNFREMESWFFRNIPLKKENLSLVGIEISKLIYSNAIGIPLTAVLQGIIGVIGYYFFGVHDLLFWFSVTCIAAMVPMVGSAIAYVSLAILFFANGDSTKGILILVYGVAIMNVFDNVFRVSIQRKIGNTHPLVTMFGVIVGIKLFGFIGLIFGPILISLFILLVRIYLNEFDKKSA